MGEVKAEEDLQGIAVVGMAGRFPGAEDCRAFWDNLAGGRETLTFFTADEIIASGVLPEELTQKRVRSRGVLEGADRFDAAFFGYSPKEAEIMDPQQRVFLEVAWEALEDAGYDPDRVPGPVGVYAGSGINSYFPYNVSTRPDVLGPFGIFPAVLLNEKDFLATRVAYKLNLRGPALSVQTACSTSLVAICNACQSLLSFDCDIALAGGVMANFPQSHSRIHEEGGMISTDGHCRPFDAEATGTLFSDGVGVVVLRRLEDAVAAGDNILAVIKGFAVNNDGSDKAGFTAPSVNGQARVIQMAQALADIPPDTITYVEAHGTATPMGDPIEIAGLTQAFRAGTDKRQFCAIGSVKSNIGHLDVAAGVAGFIKVVLSLRHRQIPPTVHFRAPNPKIEFASSPFYVADRLIDWVPPPGIPRRAGLSSFGVGGTNAHVVLEEAPPRKAGKPSRPWQLILLSARTQAALDAATHRLAEHVRARPDQPLADVAYTLQAGRRVFAHRRAIVCRDASDLVRQIEPAAATKLPVVNPRRRNPPVVFMLPGQGSQRVNMGRELYEHERVFRDIVDQCAQVLEPELGLDLRRVLYPAPGQESEAEALVVQTRITQPALFVTEYALARLWMSWGVKPAAMIGHSVGEYVAACLAGVFSLEDGLRLIAARGRLIQAQPAGTMLAIMRPVAEIEPLLGAGVDIAAVNAPNSCVASGNHEAIAALEARLNAASIVTRRLQTSHAFHSSMLDPVIQPFLEILEAVRFAPPKLPYVSNVTGQWIEDAEAQDPAYWARHLRQAVRFSDGVTLLLAKPGQVFLEVGPGGTLTSLARQHAGGSADAVVQPSLPMTKDQPSDLASLLGSLGRLWQAGLEIDWRGFYAAESRCRVPLPTYPFERQRFFVEPGVLPGAAGAVNPASIETASSGKGVASMDTGATAVVPAGESASTPDAGLEGRLCGVLHALSGIDVQALDRDATFLELGFDSLFLAQLSRSLEMEFSVPVGFRELAGDLSSISALADYLRPRIPEERVARPSPAPVQTAKGRVEMGPTAVPAGPDDLAAIRRQLEVLGRQVDLLTKQLVPPSDIVLPLSEAQREIWLACQMGDDVSRTYNESYVVRIEGDLKVDDLAGALQELVNRHDALRTAFAADGSSQRMLARLEVDLPVIDLAGQKDSPDSEHRLQQHVRAVIDEVFDPAVAPLHRFRLFRLGANRFALLLVIHHLCADGWSWGVLLRELGRLYSARTRGEPLPAVASLQYRDYVEWLGSAAHHDTIRRDESFWLERLAGPVAEVDLPADRPRPARKTYRAATVVHRFSAEVSGGLKDAARRLNCTVFQLLLASFNAWIHRVTGMSDLVVGVPMAGQAASGLRDVAHAEALVGHCVNMLPIRTSCPGEATFSALLDETKRNLFDAREHQNVSLGVLIQRLGRPHDPSRAPLVSVSLNLSREHGVDLDGLKVQTLLPQKAYSYFDLTADVIDRRTGFEVDCKYNTDLCDAGTVERWLAEWETLLTDAVQNPGARVSELRVLPDQEARQLLVEWNATARDFPRDRCVHDLFQDQVALASDRPAVVFGGETLTYAGLDRRSSQLARYLIERGVKPDVRVGVCLERSTDLVVALLAVLKAGGAYVPLDPAYPQERVSFILGDADAAVLLTQEALLPSVGSPGAEAICIDRDWGRISRQASSPLPALAHSGNLAYVIYTSGSTGKPKGVQIAHRAVVNFLCSMQREPGLVREDRLLAVTTPSFDIAGLEIFLPLVTGATLVMAPREALVDGGQLAGLLEQNRVTVMQATPATWRLLLAEGWEGKPDLKILCGGEPLPADLAAELLPRCRALWNMYGPTETTIWSTCCRVTHAADVHIGKPIDNTTIRIVDARLRPVPIGVPGELLIGGEGLARGYFKRPELTAEKFVELPGEGVRYYRTGDLARYRADGNIQCLGRLDFQVKIRGFRVELGEIEAVLSTVRGIRQAVVATRRDPSGAVGLVAYLVPEPGARLSPPDIRQHLRRDLPEYMVPQLYVEVDALPLTPNGKIDRKALEGLAPATSEVRLVVAPRTPTEQMVAEIFGEVLNTKDVGVFDNFFDLGGHSLMAARLMVRLRAVSGLEIPLRNLFERPSIAGLSEVVDALTLAAGMQSAPRAVEGREEFEF